MRLSAKALGVFLASTLGIFSAIDDGRPARRLPVKVGGGQVTISWHPGHYLYVAAPLTSTITGVVNSSANWRGIEKLYYWRDLEPAAPGQYIWVTNPTANTIYNDLKTMYNADSSHDKRLVIQINYKTFDGSNAVPAYMKTSTLDIYKSAGPFSDQYQTGYTYGQYISGPQEAQALYWLDFNPRVTPQRQINARLQALYASLGEYITNNPDRTLNAALEAVAINESAVSTHASGPTGYEGRYVVDTLLANCYVLRKAFPTKPIFDYTNFITPQTDETSYTSAKFISALVASFQQYLPGVGIGGPDAANFNPIGDSSDPYMADALIQNSFAVVRAGAYQQVPSFFAIQTPDYKWPESLDDFTVTTSQSQKYAGSYLGTYDLALNLPTGKSASYGAALGGLAANYVAWAYMSADTKPSGSASGNGYGFVFGANSSDPGTVWQKIANESAFPNQNYPGGSSKLTYTAPLAAPPNPY
jgi:hypothetical protein